MIGQRFGRLVVLRIEERAIHDCDAERRGAVCRCDCGAIWTVRPGALRSGNTRSCGCLMREQVRDRNRNRKQMVAS